MRELRKVGEFFVTRTVSERDRLLVKRNTRQMTSSLASLAKARAKAAKKNPIANFFLTRAQARDDAMRAACICAECGGKALYAISGKKWCKTHVEIGKAAYRKKWGLSK